MVAIPLPGWDPATRVVAAVLVVMLGAGMLFLAMMKWTRAHNNGRGDDWRDDLDDARDLRGE